MSYLGIDETNHGRFSEYIVGVRLKGIADSVFLERVQKGRFKGGIEGLVELCDFRFVEIQRTDQDKFTAQGIRAIAISENFKHFPDSSEIITDVRLSAEGEGFVQEAVSPLKVPKISYVVKAANKFGVSWAADRIAYELYLVYIKGKVSRFKFEQNEIRFSRLDYAFIEEHYKKKRL